MRLSYAELYYSLFPLMISVGGGSVLGGSVGRLLAVSDRVRRGPAEGPGQCEA